LKVDSTVKFEDRREFAAALDQSDPLAGYRELFRFPSERNGRAPIYLCVNSRGLQPKSTEQFVRDELDKWADYAVEGHFHPKHSWISYPNRTKAGFATLAGCRTLEVVTLTALTVDLHVLLARFYRATPHR